MWPTEPSAVPPQGSSITRVERMTWKSAQYFDRTRGGEVTGTIAAASCFSTPETSICSLSHSISANVSRTSLDKGNRQRSQKTGDRSRPVAHEPATIQWMDCCIAASAESGFVGGHYSAVPQSNIIGPEGGQMLVDKTVEIIDELWE